MLRLPSLYQFFRHQVHHGFHRQGIMESGTVDYVSDMLARFAEVRSFYALQNSAGRPLEYIVDLLDAWQNTEATGPSRRRFIQRHLGEYTLFMSGIFRDRLKARGELNYYLAHGSSAYWRCADAEINPRNRQVYRHLHQNFDRISNTLDFMRREQFPLRFGTDNVMSVYWGV